MEDFLKKKCITIMNELLERPISTLFDSPVDPMSDKAADYFKKIQCPMYLRTVLQKLVNDEYHNIREWKEDVLLVFSNSISYYGKDSQISLLALELYHQFRERIKVLDENKNILWYNELLELQKQYNEVIEGIQSWNSNRKFIKKKHKIDDNIEDELMYPKNEIRRSFVGSFSTQELEKLIENLKKLTHPSQKAHLASLIKENHPEIDITQAPINLSFLTPKTLKALKSYSENQLSLMC